MEAVLLGPCPSVALARLSLEPDLIEAPVVVDAVLLMHIALQVRMPTGRRGVVVDDRARHVLRELPLDLPNHCPAFLEIGLLRLEVQQLFQSSGCSWPLSCTHRRPSVR